MKSLKRQTYPSDLIEHIIFDDFSSDNSAQIVSKLLIKNRHKSTFIKNNKNLGICKNQNKAIKMAKGKYLTTLHDDIWDERRLEVLVSLMEKSNAKFAGICSNFSIIDKNNKILVDTFFSKDYNLPKNLFQEFLLSNKLLISSPTALIKIDILKKLGGYDERFILEDFDMWLKLTLRYKIKYNKQNLVQYRIHDSNSSSINWTKIVEDNYRSLDSIIKHTHNDQQKIAIIYKKFILSKELIIINKKLTQEELVAFFMELYILIQSYKSINIANNRLIDELLDHLFIYFFKRNSFAARKAKKN